MSDENTSSKAAYQWRKQFFDTNRLIPTYFKMALPVVFSMVITLIYI